MATGEGSDSKFFLNLKYNQMENGEMILRKGKICRCAGFGWD